MEVDSLFVTVLPCLTMPIADVEDKILPAIAQPDGTCMTIEAEHFWALGLWRS